MAVSEQLRALANGMRSALGREGDLSRALSDDGRTQVDLFTLTDAPEKGVTTYVTLGVSERSLDLQVEQRDLRVEFVLSARDRSGRGKHAIEDAALTAIASGRASYGSVITEALDPARKGGERRHLFLGSSTALPLARADFADRIVTWLTLVPISSSERDYVRNNGGAAFETLLETAGADIFDLDRPPVA